jgi:aminomethyltransferase
MERTPLYERHLEAGASMVDFGGWEMPVQYPTGILREHLQTRREAGLFDVSHMGRFSVRGPGALPFLQHALTGNAAALRPGRAQYTLIADADGGAIDDAYLYCLARDEYLLVVNASNREKDWVHLGAFTPAFADLDLQDRTREIAMISVQGPRSRRIVAQLSAGSRLPEPGRNNLCTSRFDQVEVVIARTGYTGEPLGFELFLPATACGEVWDRLVGLGASPVGLGARDTLRLEAALPLYGHELGIDPEGRPIPIYACPTARLGVSHSPLKGDFVGREALARQAAAYRKALHGDVSGRDVLPRVIRPFQLLDRGVARQGAPVYAGARLIGHVTSGTVAPYWVFAGEGLSAVLTERSDRRAIGMALLDVDVAEHAEVEVDIRGIRVRARLAPWLVRSDAPPYCRPIAFGALPDSWAAEVTVVAQQASRAADLVRRAAENTRWRQRLCINLIPSEMTQSPLARALSIMDPAFRYAEHRRVRALLNADVYYYQGTDFIAEVERDLVEQLRRFLGAREVETRVISGQMANMTVFSALVAHLNRDDRRAEPRRIRSVVNHHIIRGGHLSAQPMGALRDFVARDPSTEGPAVFNFPVREDNPYRIDVEALPELFERARPELVILGKSMILYPEPVAEVRRIIDAMGLESVLMYDMAHVLGLVGPHFQEPFDDGADLVTGSTHKTFFGTQRGVVAGAWKEDDPRFRLWEAIEARTFPGSVSNHHLGTLLGLLVATYEMNAFCDAYQPAVLRNARALAGALADLGLRVAGDPSLGYTQTHQVVVEVGDGRGVEMAQRLEASGIVCNYQATPTDEGFTTASALRLGTAEMTRFGMEEEDFREVAQLIHDVVVEGREVAEEVARFRSRFLDLHYCFAGPEFSDGLRELRELI